MTKGFSVDFVSPTDFDHLAAEVCYDGQILCRIKSERADGELEVDFLYEMRLPVRPLCFPLSELMELMKEVSDEVRSLREAADGGEKA